jgi:hypothetical protein
MVKIVATREIFAIEFTGNQYKTLSNELYINK